MAAPLSSATPMILDPTGLTAPDVTITWNEVVLRQASPITNEYAAFGIAFAPNTVFYNTQPGFFPTDPHAANFDFADHQSVLTSMFFTGPVIAAAFNFITNPGTTMFTALLSNSLIETFNAATDLSGTTLTHFYGFNGIIFDEIQFLAPGNNAFEIDNVQIQRAAVPEPATLMLFGAGLIGLGFTRRRRRA
ncbi:MAG: PEP-CTERM sorting domain-containing protein [Gammaproteobacteria bacterium]